MDCWRGLCLAINLFLLLATRQAQGQGQGHSGQSQHMPLVQAIFIAIANFVVAAAASTLRFCVFHSLVSLALRFCFLFLVSFN